MTTPPQKPKKSRDPQVTKTQIIDDVARMAGLSKSQATNAIQALLDCIVSTLAHGHNVSLQQFGVFQIKMRAARMGRDQKNKQPVLIPPRKTVAFKPAQIMKDLVARH